ncbi:MAG: hypothetical protein O0Y03_00505, partial [Methanocorpusculum sp.]|nr:hypothetical protein [Methanocorpusculum sp.]
GAKCGVFTVNLNNAPSNSNVNIGAHLMIISSIRFAHAPWQKSPLKPPSVLVARSGGTFGLFH